MQVMISIISFEHRSVCVHPQRQSTRCTQHARALLPAALVARARPHGGRAGHLHVPLEALQLRNGLFEFLQLSARVGPCVALAAGPRSLNSLRHAHLRPGGSWALPQSLPFESGLGARSRGTASTYTRVRRVVPRPSFACARMTGHTTPASSCVTALACGACVSLHLLSICVLPVSSPSLSLYTDTNARQYRMCLYLM